MIQKERLIRLNNPRKATTN